MDRRERKAAIAAFKERKPAWGVYAVICTATGEAWVGQSRHVDTRRNGLWAGLRFGASPFRSLQEAWTLHGEAEFRFEELERLGDGLSELAGKDELKKRQALWAARLHAVAI